MPKITTHKGRKPTSVSRDDDIGIATRSALPSDAMNVNPRNETWKPGVMRPFTPQINFTTSRVKKSPADVMIGQNLFTRRGTNPVK